MEFKEKKNIFIKLIDFIKKDKVKMIPAKIDSPKKTESQYKYRDEIYLNRKENVELLKLQNQFENGEINFDEMTYEQVRSLYSLYKRQVSELTKKLNEKNTELNMMLFRISKYSKNI